jgi:hypothetical protein
MVKSHVRTEIMLCTSLMPQSKLHILPHEVGLLVRITSTKIRFASLQKHVGFLIKFVKYYEQKGMVTYWCL